MKARPGAGEGGPPGPAVPGWPEGARGRVVRSSGARWSVVEVGEGPPLLLLHGSGASHASFGRLAGPLSTRFRLIAPDLPGHGGTGASPGFRPTPAGMAAAVAELLDRLGVVPTVVCGHSAGAAILAQMIVDGRIRPALGVGLAAALTPLRGVARAVMPRSAAALSSPVASRLVAAYAGRTSAVRDVLAQVGSPLDPAAVERYRRLAARPDHLAGVLRMMASWDLAPLYRRLPEVQVPWLLVAGERDHAVPLRQQREVCRRLPRARLRTVSGVGHLLHEERPDEVARLVLDAATGLAPDAGRVFFS